MSDFPTVLSLIGSVVFLLGALALVFWPLTAAILALVKAAGLGLSAREARSFVLTDEGKTIWFEEEAVTSTSPSALRDDGLRLSVLFACGVEAAVVLVLTVFVFRHANPKGDGMEMALAGFAFMLIFVPLTLPAFLLARQGRGLVAAAILAGLAAFAYFALWLETLSEMGLLRG